MEQQGEQVYHLKLNMLLTVLQANRQTCQIEASVSPGTLAGALENRKVSRGRDKSSCSIELTLISGQVATAIIRDPFGQTLVLGEAALIACRQCGELSWIVRPVSFQNQDIPSMKKLATDPRVEAIERQPAPTTWSQRTPPRLMHLLTQEEVGVLPRKHRQVLLLIDGKRGIDELCRVLNCTSDQLIVIMNELVARKLIF